MQPGFPDEMSVSRVSTSSRQISSKLAEEYVILDFESGQYYGLNETGSRIWDLISKPQTIRSIVDILQAEYDGDENLLTVDVKNVIEALTKKGLIQVHAKTIHDGA